MRISLAMSAMLILMGCGGQPPSALTNGLEKAPDDFSRDDDHGSNGTFTESCVFGIANDFSGKLTEEEENAVPEPLRGAFYIESMKHITTAELEQTLKLKTLVAEENRDGSRFVALKDLRHVQFSDEVSGQMIVIERYLVIPN